MTDREIHMWIDRIVEVSEARNLRGIYQELADFLAEETPETLAWALAGALQDLNGPDEGNE